MQTGRGPPPFLHLHPSEGRADGHNMHQDDSRTSADPTTHNTCLVEMACTCMST